jgi:hypothetical protein
MVAAPRAATSVPSILASLASMSDLGASSTALASVLFFGALAEDSSGHHCCLAMPFFLAARAKAVCAASNLVLAAVREMDPMSSIASCRDSGGLLISARSLWRSSPSGSSLATIA